MKDLLVGRKISKVHGHNIDFERTSLALGFQKLSEGLTRNNGMTSMIEGKTHKVSWHGKFQSRHSITKCTEKVDFWIIIHSVMFN